MKTKFLCECKVKLDVSVERKIKFNWLSDRHRRLIDLMCTECFITCKKIILHNVRNLLYHL